jgi:hypothetical protein
MSRIALALAACLAYASALSFAHAQSRAERAQRQAAQAATAAHCEAAPLQMADVRTSHTDTAGACACAIPARGGEARGNTVLAAVRAVVR